MKNRKSVFEVYAHEYDLITNAAQREAYHAREVAALIERFAPKSVLDAGCASGLTTLLFARQGVDSVGIDRSRPILETAQKTRGNTKLPVTFCYADFTKLPKRMHGKFDMVACLANAISGVGSVANLRQSIRNFYDVLAPGGTLVLQMLNYAAIKADILLPIKATENNGIVYERFSERQGRSLFIYVTRADFTAKPPTFEVFRHQFDNFSPDQVERAVRRAGFEKVQKYADLYVKKRFGARSRDLVITARRPKR